MHPKVEVENVGPVRKASIELRPLTIFIGPNGSGKSYTAMMIYALHKAFTKRLFPPFFPPFRHYIIRRIMRDVKFNKPLPNTLEQFIEILSPLLNDAMKEILIIEDFSRELERIYGAELQKIINVESRLLRINMLNDYCKYSILLKSSGNNKLEEFSINSKQLLLDELRNDRKFETMSKHYDKLLNKISANNRKFKFDLEDILFELDLPIDKIFRFISPFIYAYFLPAARSGILQAHKAIASTLVALAPRLPIYEESTKIPTLTGVAADFISTLLTMGRYDPEYRFLRRRRMKDRTTFEGQISLIENEILNGEIVVERKGEVYELIYKDQKVSIPLIRASSMVSELAPLDLYLKYIVNAGDLLILEEPEAHLHPNAQRLVARLIAKLIRNGVNVLITTHSDYLLNQFNILMKMSKLTSKERKEKGYDEEDYLKMDEVSAYLFKKGRKGYVTEQLKVDEDGIPVEEFVKIAVEMGNELALIEHEKE